MPDGRNTILFYSAADDPAPWRTALEAELPEAAFHVFPDIPAQARVTTAIVWSPPEGFFTPFTDLRLIVNLGAGVDSLLRQTDLPDVPIIRLSDPGMVAMMTSYVLFAVIRYARDIDKFEAPVPQVGSYMVRIMPGLSMNIWSSGSSSSSMAR